MTANNKIGRFDAPIENYLKELPQVRTLEEFKIFGERYSMILDDAAPAVAAMDEKKFDEFLAQLHRAYVEIEPPSPDWMEKYGAIVLPALFIYVLPTAKRCGMGSGFVLNRLLEEKLAKIIDGKFVLSAEMFH